MAPAKDAIAELRLFSSANASMTLRLVVGVKRPLRIVRAHVPSLTLLAAIARK